MEQQQTVVAVMTDLFFAVKVATAAKTAGFQALFAETQEKARELAARKPAILVFDLTFTAVDPIRLIEEIKADAALHGVLTVAFVPHVQVELKKRAEETGCDYVFARSVFEQNLAKILNRYANNPEKDPESVHG